MSATIEQCDNKMKVEQFKLTYQRDASRELGFRRVSETVEFGNVGAARFR
jgi:hypothetical protein